eukprot:363566-Chlamydomonas_euryale.AAC.9
MPYSKHSWSNSSSAAARAAGEGRAVVLVLSFRSETIAQLRASHASPSLFSSAECLPTHCGTPGVSPHALGDGARRLRRDARPRANAAPLIVAAVWKKILDLPDQVEESPIHPHPATKAAAAAAAAAAATEAAAAAMRRCRSSSPLRDTHCTSVPASQTAGRA